MVFPRDKGRFSLLDKEETRPPGYIEPVKKTADEMSK